MLRAWEVLHRNTHTRGPCLSVCFISSPDLSTRQAKCTSNCMSGSNKAVVAAIAGNIAVCVIKFIAATATGSSTMLAESFHSVADSCNDSFLLLGKKRSSRPSDHAHPFGYGQELYFWSFLLAIVVFAVGAGFSFYEGISRLLHPIPLENPMWNYVVLSLAALFEGASLVVGYRQFRLEAGSRTFWRTLRESKDPSTFSVVLEDGAALIGLAIAFAGIWAAEHFGQPVYDGVASILIGILLTAVSVVLARESKGLLLGEALDANDVHKLRELVEQCEGVERSAYPLTMYFGPEQILAAIDVQFASDLSAGGVAQTVNRIESAVRQHNGKIRRIFIEARSFASKTSEP